MRTRAFIQCLVVLALAASQACARQDAKPERIETARPNIIVILADDLGWGDVGVGGARLIKTPNIDRIGREGAILTQFHAGANVCTPSRAALLTGRYPIRSGMQHVIYPHSEDGMPESEITIAELLRDAGYATGMIGKWHLGHRDEYWPTNQGFEEFYGVPYSNDMKPFDLYRQKTVIESPVDQAALTDRYALEAAAFIRKHAGEPFFLYYAETAPHLPLHAPDHAAKRSAAGLYGDVVEHLDAGIGAILDALKEADIEGDTLIIVTSDNGPWFEGDAGAHRGRKGGVYQGSYLVPFVARWPGVIPAGVVSGAMSMNIDLLPTLARAGGAATPSDRQIDGADILPLLTGEETISPHDTLFFFNGNDIVAARNQRFRLVLNDYYRSYYVPFERYGASLLFDLEVDPEERFTYGRDNPDAAASLKAAVAAMRADVARLAKPAGEASPPTDKEAPIGPVLAEE